MSFHGIRVKDGQYQVIETEDGRHPRDVGPVWPTPKSAAVYLDTLEGRHNVSPLRVPADDPARPPAGSSAGPLTGS